MGSNPRDDVFTLKRNVHAPFKLLAVVNKIVAVSNLAS